MLNEIIQIVVLHRLHGFCHCHHRLL